MYMYPYIHTCGPTNRHTHLLTYQPTYLLTHIHIHTHISIDISTYEHIHVCIHFVPEDLSVLQGLSL